MGVPPSEKSIKSFFNRNIRRVTSGDREDTDRDSDNYNDTLDQIKEADKEAKRYQELADSQGSI